MSLQGKGTDPTANFVSIRDVAETFGFTLRAIRFYESKGLVAPARGGRSRLYSSQDVERLRLIARLKVFGLSLGEIKGILADPGDGPYGLTVEFCGALIERLTRQRADLDAAVTELQQLASDPAVV
jgi:DNA-binding transcriptional MerR regulator